jgi:hypothetical protein
MEDREVEAGPATSATRVGGTDNYAYLLGTPPVHECMEFLTTRSLEARGARQATLAQEWHIASERIRELEAAEGGCADNAELISLPDRMAEMAKCELEDPWVQRSLSMLPHRWALVDLDQLIVHQRSVDLSYIGKLEAEFPSGATQEDLFRFAAGHLREAPQVRVTRSSENVFTFSSPSADLRLLDMALLDPVEVQVTSATGRPTHIVGVFVGFGVNCICALRIQQRLILINGTHHACMLRRRGGGRVPCLVREVFGDDDLDLIGAIDVKRNLPSYVRSRRPPLLRDFFDPKIRKIIPVAPATRLVHVQVNTQRSRLAV